MTGRDCRISDLAIQARASARRSAQKLHTRGYEQSAFQWKARKIAKKEDLDLYHDAVLYLLYHRFASSFSEERIRSPRNKLQSRQEALYQPFIEDWRRYFGAPVLRDRMENEACHTFAIFFQIQRAFRHIFKHIIGSSMSAAQLRAAVWQSIFTHDMRRYQRTMYERMGDFATLITGPSGTGKELVARAIALSRYVPFDKSKTTFTDESVDSFHALNLAALSPTLIESELFGHRRGAFTGAIGDRKGWLEICPPLGTVFLDEIGDLDLAIQVKLLRVIENRTFQPVGDTSSRRFNGKLIAATNRELSTALHQGQFRLDLYYRLCSDQIVTPSLYEQLQESPEAISELIFFMARRVAGPEAEPLATEAEKWVRENLGDNYEWPGNYRELEQCVRNILIRSEYRPPQLKRPSGRQALFADAEKGELTADQLLRRYCTLVYARTGSYEETGRRLQLDRRTVKSRIDPHLLEELSGAG